MDITKFNLPSAVEVGGNFYTIHTDFKRLLRFNATLKENPEDLTRYDFIYTNKIPEDRVGGIIAVIDFMNTSNEYPKRTGDESNEVVLDYEIDADLIYSAFMELYKIDLIESNMHWFKFRALLDAVHDCKLAQVVDIRLWKNETGENSRYTKRMQKLHDAWKLPQPEDNEDDEKLNNFISKLK